MTREEIIARHDQQHLQHALRRLKRQSDGLMRSVEQVQKKFPKAKTVAEIASKASTVATVIKNAHLKLYETHETH